MTIENVAIVGGGPAGIATAIQLKRHGIAPVVFEKDALGGLLRNANLVENYPGFPEGISGPELVRLFAEQLHHSSVQICLDEVIRIEHESARDPARGCFHLQTTQGGIRARVVVIATGTKPKEFTDLELPRQAAARILHEVHPIRDVRDAKIVIVGAGDAACDYALSLAARNDVVILNRGDSPSCLPLLFDRIRACPRITYRTQCRLSRVSVDAPEGLLLEYEASKLHADYLVFAIGREPQLGCFTKEPRESAHEIGEIRETGEARELDELEARGDLHFVGDVRSGIFRQTAIAVGQGILAAMRIAQQLQERSG